MVPRNEDWKDAIIQVYKDRSRAVSRYAIKIDPKSFDISKLDKAVSFLPIEYELRMIDEQLYQVCKAEARSVDLVANIRNYNEYHKLGLGAVILKDNVIVSNASSYSRYREGIEIEIDTRKGNRLCLRSKTDYGMLEEKFIFQLGHTEQDFRCLSGKTGLLL